MDKNTDSFFEFVKTNYLVRLVVLASAISYAVFQLVSWHYDRELNILKSTLDQTERLNADTIQGLQMQLNRLMLRLESEIETISVTKAHYGRNKWKDVTNWFAAKCNGKSSCIFEFEPEKSFGDHEHFVEKGIVINYRCRAESANKTFELQPFKEPSTQKIRLLCNDQMLIN